MAKFEDNPFGEPMVDNPFAVCIFVSVYFVITFIYNVIPKTAHFCSLLSYPLTITLAVYTFVVFFIYCLLRFYQDPAAQQARTNATNNAIVILDDYNPFEEDDKNKKSQYTEGSNNILAPQSQSQIPAYNQSSQSNQAYGTGTAPQISTAELQVPTYLPTVL